jgi:S1-C subfamily serine protease
MTNRRKFWVIGLGVSILIGFTLGMWNPSQTSTRSSIVITPVRTPDSLLYRCAPEVLVHLDGGEVVASGSAVFVSPTVLLTAKHMTTIPLSTLTVSLSSGTEYKVVRIYAQRDHDTAVLVIEPGYNGPTAVVSLTPELNVGDLIVCVGWFMPNIGLKCSTTFGHIAGLDLPPGDTVGDIECDITCGPGMSGGGVFHDGRLIGIVSRGGGGFLIIERVPDWKKILRQED